MPSLFRDKFATIASPMLDTRFCESVTVTRRGDSTAGVKARWDQKKIEVADVEDVLSTEVVLREWIIKKTLYVVSAVVVTPIPGDTITDESGSVWEILPDGKTPAVRTFDEPAYWVVSTKQTA